MGAGHAPGWVLIHQVGASDDRRQGQAARDALAAAHQIGHHPIVLEPPHGAGAPERGLDLVEDQHDIVLVAPGAHLLRVVLRPEGDASALIGLADDSCDAVGAEPLLLQGLQEEVEARVLAPEAIRERHLHHVRVEVDDPFLERGDAADHLRAHGAPMERALVAHEGDLLIAADRAPVGPRQLDGGLGCLGAGGQQEDLLQRVGRELRQLRHEPGAHLAGEAVVVQQRLLGLGADGLHDLRPAVPGVGHEHARAPVDPGVAPGVVDLEAICSIPNHIALAAHRAGLIPVERFEDGYRVRRGDGCLNAAELGVHLGDDLRDNSGFAHVSFSSRTVIDSVTATAACLPSRCAGGRSRKNNSPHDDTRGGINRLGGSSTEGRSGPARTEALRSLPDLGRGCQGCPVRRDISALD